MKISFDFDGTLRDIPEIKAYCAKLTANTKHNIYIVTKRYSSFFTKKFPLVSDESSEVYSLAELLGIKDQNVYFTNRQRKIEIIKQLNIDIHIDDDPKEIRLLKNHDVNCLLINALGVGAWRYYLDKYLGCNLLEKRYNLYESSVMSINNIFHLFRTETP